MNFSKIKNLAFLLAGVALFNACEKPESTDQLADNGQKIIRIEGYGGMEGNFNNSALILDPANTSETVEYRLEYLGPQVFDHDVTITVGVDAAALASYNASHSATPYEALPAAFYTLDNTTTIIKAGEVFSQPLSITFNPSLFDPSKSYMIPITILTINGAPADVKKAPGTGTAYFHIIGNPLAGTYDEEGYFYHPTGPRDLADTKVLMPVSSTVLLLPVADLYGSGYYAYMETDLATNKVTITAAPGAAGAPYTQFDAGLPAPYVSAWPRSNECDNTYDPATKTFKLRYGYMGANGWRVAEEILTKQ